MQSVGAVSDADEQRRLEALRNYGVLDSLPEQGYEDVTALASFICGAPISLISLVDEDRQWFKSARGLGARETPRSQSFCANTIGTAETLIVEDAYNDLRFRDNPLVTGEPNIRFYAGAPIIEKNGHVLGTVCVIDTQPRVLSKEQISALESLARQVMSLLEQRKTIAHLEEAIAAVSEAERVVHESERRLRTLVDSFPTLAWVANADGWISWYNRRWYEYTGTTPEEMEGWGWQSVHDPVWLPKVMDLWTTCIREQQPFEMIFPLRGSDGTMRSFLTRIIPIRLGGTVVQWLGTNTEVDELQRTRQALEESEAGLKQVLTATSDAVMSVNRDWVVTYLNPAAEQLYGSAKGVAGRNLWEVFPHIFHERSPFVEHYSRAMDEGVAGGFEAEIHEPLNFMLGVEVFPSKDGIVTFSRDITKLKHATAAILKNEKLAAVGRLASSIAHEINNPLAAVTNLLYLARGSSEPEVIHTHLDIAERELRRVAVIANQTLRFHKQTTKPLPVSCSELFENTLSLYQGKLINSRIHVEKRKRALRSAVCFEGEIRQVVSNLISNAVDAMQVNGGRLLLRSREATNWRTGEKGLVMTVADNGSGMPAQARKKVFEAFFSTKGFGGTGLGLWVSKEIVDRHRGTLIFRSSEQEKRHGTVFVLFLPFGGVGI